MRPCVKRENREEGNEGKRWIRECLLSHFNLYTVAQILWKTISLFLSN